MHTDAEMKLVNKSSFSGKNFNTLSSKPRLKQSYNDEKLKSSNSFAKKKLNEKQLLRNRESSKDNLSIKFNKVKHVRRSSLKMNNNHNRINLKFSSDSTNCFLPSHK